MREGCLLCVRSELEDRQDVAPDVISANNKYSARDFANFAVQEGIAGAVDVKEYLDNYWSHIPVRHGQ